MCSSDLHELDGRLQLKAVARKQALDGLLSQGDPLPSKVGQCPLSETGMPGTERAADTDHILRTCPAAVKSGEGVLSRRGASVSQRI